MNEWNNILQASESINCHHLHRVRSNREVSSLQAIVAVKFPYFFFLLVPLMPLVVSTGRKITSKCMHRFLVCPHCDRYPVSVFLSIFFVYILCVCVCVCVWRVYRCICAGNCVLLVPVFVCDHILFTSIVFFFFFFVCRVHGNAQSSLNRFSLIHDLLECNDALYFDALFVQWHHFDSFIFIATNFNAAPIDHSPQRHTHTVSSVVR